MGKIVGTSPSSISGSVGLYTYRQTKDGTVVSEKVKAKGVGKSTLRQCMTKLQLANLHHFYKSFYGSLEGSFENIPKTQSNLNAFIKANFGLLPIYLSKQVSNFGAAVVAPYQVAQGSLLPLNIINGTTPRTTLLLGSLVIDAATTIGEFSRAVVDHNLGYANGDQISYFSLIQNSLSIGDFHGIPTITTNKYEVTLDTDDNEHKLWDFVGKYGFSSVAADGQQFLGCSGTPAVGGFTWVHSRGFGAEMKVSTAFVTTNNAAVIDAWSGAEALEKAAVSYGGYKAARFLEPGETSANVAVEGGDDVQTGAVFSGSLRVVSGSTSVTNANAQRVRLSAGSVGVELSGTNMTAFAQPVALQMASSSSATTLVDVPATLNAGSSTADKAVLTATVAAPNLWLAGIKVNGQVVKTFAAFGGGTTPSTGGDEEE
ncbi:MAG: hypothetical protein MJZ67_07735 [Bacteroidales bacterium]|nr:hypothetical protein [Bacteroidales bacterium]